MSIDGFPNVWEVDEASYGAWIRKSELQFTDDLVSCEEYSFSIVMPVFNTPLEFLREAIDSVILQTHANWHLCIANDASTDAAVCSELKRYRDSDARVRLVNLEENTGIASASNHALKLATGDYVVLMDHDDVIPAHALQTVANILKEDPQIRFLYSDSDHLDETGKRCKPFFKPEWDYIRFLGQNYLNHLTVVEHSLLQKVGGWKQGYEGSQDYDLFLRIVEHTEREEIKHIPHVLYHWRVVPHSVSRSSLGRAVKAARKAISDHLVRIGLPAAVKPAGKAVIYNRVEWPPPRRRKSVLLLVYGDFISEAKRLIKVANCKNPVFDTQVLQLGHASSGIEVSLIVDQIAREGGHDLIGFYDSSLVPVNDSWLLSMVSMASIALFGLVGAKCITRDGLLCGGPVFADASGSRSRAPDVASASEQATEDSRGYVANLMLDQGVPRLSPGFVMFRREILNRYRATEKKAWGIESVIDRLCDYAIKSGFSNSWSPNIVFRERGVESVDNAKHSARADKTRAGSTKTDVSPQFLYPNPNLELIDWRIHWSENS